MSNTATIPKIKDNGGRRLGADRRLFSYTFHIPERRMGKDRRISLDRRSGLGLQGCRILNEKLERRVAFQFQFSC